MKQNVCNLCKRASLSIENTLLNGNTSAKRKISLSRGDVLICISTEANARQDQGSDQKALQRNGLKIHGMRKIGAALRSFSNEHLKSSAAQQISGILPKTQSSSSSSISPTQRARSIFWVTSTTPLLVRPPAPRRWCGARACAAASGDLACSSGSRAVLIHGRSPDAEAFAR